MKKIILFVLAAAFVAAGIFLAIQPSGSTPTGLQAATDSPAASSSQDALAVEPSSPATPGTPGNTPASSPLSAPSGMLEPSTPPTVGPASAPAPSFVTARPAALALRPGSGQSEEAIRTATDIPTLLQSVDLSDPDTRAQVAARMAALENERKQAILDQAKAAGIPVRIIGDNGALALLHDIRDGEPLYRTTKNKNAAVSSGASAIAVAPSGLDGSGVKVGVWDGGSVRATHRELAGRVTLQNASAPLDDHATHVAGTIGAAGFDASAKGMAPKSRIESYDWDNDYAEATAAATATATDFSGVSLSNHSYGYNAATVDMGRYENEARTSDALAVSSPYLLSFWAAGNEQDFLTAKSGFQSITFNALAKNVLTIGAVSDAVSGGSRQLSAATMTSFSSWGPCDDGRIKPDLVANGVSVYSSVSTGDAAYDGTYDGTSMATPSAAGSTALLVQSYQKFFGQRPGAALLKALLIHTADDLGNPGPDYKFGWGHINVKAAADVLTAHKNSSGAPKIFEGVLTNTSRSGIHTISWDGVSPIRATLVWIDPAGAAQSAADSRTPNLVHDLDLKVAAPGGASTHLPFVMPFVGVWTNASFSANATTGRNKTDNVEQVLIARPAAPGTYTITISAAAPLSTASQAYALVVTGSTTPSRVNPPPTVLLSASNVVATVGETVTLTANASDLNAAGSPGLISSVEFFLGTERLGTDLTAPYTFDWTPPVAGLFQLTARALDSEGAAATSDPLSVTAEAAQTGVEISFFYPPQGTPGAEIYLSGTGLDGITAATFNGTASGFVESADSETLYAEVPKGATSGKIQVSGSSKSGLSETDFIVLPTEDRVLINQVYAAGGLVPRGFKQDYIELYNAGTRSLSLRGWSLQIAPSNSARWTVIPLAGSIPAKGYFLIGLASGSRGQALPMPDVRAPINLAFSQGKLALVRSTKTLAASAPSDAPGVADFVGYGLSKVSEGDWQAPAPDDFFAIQRDQQSDTDTNGWDFTYAYPNPRNSRYLAPQRINPR